MKSESEIIIQSWAPVLQEFLDPIKFIEALPRLFVIGSHDYSMVNNKAREPCEAVKVAIDVILRSDIVIDDVVRAISESGHKWLACLINGDIEDHDVEVAAEQFSACEEIKKNLTILAPNIKTRIDGRLVAQNLKEYKYGAIISDGDLQGVECRYREEGNEASVRLLLSILMRCEPGWWDIFTKVVEEMGYDVNLVKTMQNIRSLYKPICSPTDRTETNHGFLDECVQGASAASPSNEDQSSQSMDALPEFFPLNSEIRHGVYGNTACVLEISLNDSPNSIHDSEKSGCPVVHSMHDTETSNSVDITETETYVESVQEEENEAALEMQAFSVGYCTNPIRKNPLDLGDMISLEDLHGCHMPPQPTLSGINTATNENLPKKAGYSRSPPRRKTEQEIMINADSFTEQMKAKSPPSNENIPIETGYNGSLLRSRTNKGSTKKTRSLSEQMKSPSPPANGIIPREARYDEIPSRSKTEKVLTENATLSSKQMGARSHHVNNIMPREARSSSGPLRSKLEMPLKENAIFGENTIIFTGQSLKVVAEIVKRRFPNILDSADRKICFLVPEITGNCDTLKFIFATEQWSVGFYHHESSTPLNVLMQDSQVVIMTAQSLLEWLSLGSDVDKITEFDMLIFDECGRACQQGPYREVLLKYLGAKSNSRKVSLPQVIGLTSSEGSGRILCQSDADKYIQELVALFDARGGIEVLESESSKTRSKSTSSKKKSTKERNTMISDPFIFYLCKTIDRIVDQLYKLQIGRIKDLRRPLNISKGKPEYLKWCEDLMKKADLLEDETLKSDIETCAKYLVSFNTGLLIKTKCRSVDAANALTRDLQSIAMGLKTGANRRLVEQRMMQISANAQTDLKTLPFDKDVRDPSSLQEIKNKIKERKSGQIFIFVEDMEIVEPLKSWIREDIELKKFLDGVRVSILIYHLNDSPAIPSSSDMVIYYDRRSSQFSAKGKFQTMKHIDIKSTEVVANDKAKFSKSLLINHSIKEIQQKRQENKREFTNELDHFQAGLLSRNCGNRPVRNSKRSS